MRYLLTIVFYLFIQTTSSSAPLKDFTVSYDLYHDEMYIGQTSRNLVANDKFLTFSSVAKTAGIAAWFYDITISEKSKLRYKDQQLNFFSYSYNENKNDKKRVINYVLINSINSTTLILKNSTRLNQIYTTHLVLLLPSCMTCKQVIEVSPTQ